MLVNPSFEAELETSEEASREPRPQFSAAVGLRGISICHGRLLPKRLRHAYLQADNGPSIGDLDDNSHVAEPFNV